MWNATLHRCPNHNQDGDGKKAVKVMSSKYSPMSYFLSSSFPLLLTFSFLPLALYSIYLSDYEVHLALHTRLRIALRRCLQSFLAFETPIILVVLHTFLLHCARYNQPTMLVPQSLTLWTATSLLFHITTTQASSRHSHVASLSSTSSSPRATTCFDQPIKVRGSVPFQASSFNGSPAWTLEFDVADVIGEDTFTGHCRAGVINPDQIGPKDGPPADVNGPPIPINMLVSCSPPAWQFQLLSWKNAGEWSMQVQHIVQNPSTGGAQVPLQEAEDTFVKVSGYLGIDCSFGKKACRGKEFSIGVKDYKVAALGERGDLLSRRCDK